MFSYTQLVFLFHFLKDFCIAQDHIVVICFFLIQKDFDTFHITFLNLFFVCFLIRSSLRIFRYFYMYMKKLVKNIYKKMTLKILFIIFLWYFYYYFYLFINQLVLKNHKKVLKNHIKVF